MINLNNVNSKLNIFHGRNILGKLVRLPLMLIPKSLILPILQGPARGLKWITGSYNHGCWMGIYEFEKQKIVSRTIKENNVVLELGAHVGYFTIIMSKLVGQNGKIFAFEPIKRNIEFIDKHLTINNINNVIVSPFGAWIKNDRLSFDEETHHAKGKISSSGDNKIDVIDICYFMESEIDQKIDVIKMDIEGAERAIFPHILKYIKKHNTKLIISTHGDDITEEIVDLSEKNLLKCEGLQWSRLPQEKTIRNSSLLYIYHD